MKKIKLLISIVVIIFLICLISKLDILDFSVLTVSEEKLSNYSQYYFNKLQQDEKEMYVRIDEAVKKMEDKVFLGLQNSPNLTEKVTKVLTAYFYDNPECYYISNQYIISTRDFKIFEYSTVKLEYLVNRSEIATQNAQLENAIENILNTSLHEGMTDYEKELALHDALVEHINYYKYEDIKEIPDIKHTAYGALVEKEAVCDGYSKAFKMLLDAAGIENIIINGTIDNIAHAWNMVELDGEYYHVDITSNKLEDSANKYVIHAYFNVTDEMITRTHNINTTFEHPNSSSTKYNYYIQNEYYISYEESLRSKLKTIVSKQDSSEILEVRLDERYYIQAIVDALYDINFSDWRFSGETSVSYNKIEDVYIFLK